MLVQRSASRRRWGQVRTRLGTGVERRLVERNKWIFSWLCRADQNSSGLL